ncbi:MAG: amidohydrolase [bacterium]|nr:amidohydrolase [bacterium]
MKTLLINAKVLTGKNKFTNAVGFDSSTGSIIFAGSKEQALRMQNEFDEVIDCKGKLVMPAFAEGHCHFIKGSFVNSQLNLREASSGKDFVNGINEFKAGNKGKWIFGGYFSDANFQEEIELSSAFLNEICSDTPVIISRFDSHSAFANTKALEMSGILRQKENFTAEEIVMDEAMNPTGELKERAREFVLDRIPSATLKERTDIVSDEMKKLHSFGITSISDITLTEDIEIYKELINRNDLLLRVDSRLPFQEYNNLSSYRKDFSALTDLIQFKSLKAFYDGSLSSRTAYMHSNYRNTDHNGIRTEFVNSGDFEKMFFEIDDAEYQMSVHAIGDKAVSELLDLNEELIRRNGVKDRRFRIEHAQHIAEDDFERFRKLNVIASVQPAHLFSDAKTSVVLLNDFSSEHNYRKLIDIGAKVCFGTDFPIVSENPFETIYFAVTRKAAGFENGFVIENRIKIEDCIEAYTMNNAYATFNENVTGNIVAGKYADIIVMRDDLFEMNEDELRDAKVSQTYFAGKKVYDSEN